jgi:ATP phosphoribosyltransferase regulatory subunit
MRSLSNIVREEGAHGAGSGPASPRRSEIPHGVQDRFLQDAARRRRAEAALRDCFARWGYNEVITPTFEYYDNLILGASPGLQLAMYRFLDREGHTLALRADFTPQLARAAATKLFDQPMPLRCSYLGSVFRYEEPQAGRKREFTQAGVELIGVDTAAADAEAVALAISALDALALPDFQVNLGQMALFRALTGDLSTASTAAIRDAIDHKNAVRLEAALDSAGVTGQHRAVLRQLPELVGGPEVLDRARTHCERLDRADAALSAVDRLARVYQLLEVHGVGDRVILDLGEVRGMDYYTGITFRGVAPGLGWPVLGGGRYNDLIARFGRAMAAVGFGLGIERALLVQVRQGGQPPSIAPHLLVHGCDQAPCMALVQRLRARGLRVEIDLLGLDACGLADQAQRRGISRTLRCSDDGWHINTGKGERVVSESAVLQESEAWRSQPRVGATDEHSDKDAARQVQENAP